MKSKRWTKKEIVKQNMRRAAAISHKKVTLPQPPWKKYDRPDYIKNKKS